MHRRDFLGANALVLASGALAAANQLGAAEPPRADHANQPHQLAAEVHPRKHASAKVGQRNVELAAEALGRKAKELLDALPENQRNFNLKAVSPEHWWLV
jgi:hypothetical protein